MPSPRIAPKSFEEYLYSKRNKYGDKGKPLVEVDPNHKISKIYINFAKKIKSSYF